MAATYSMKSAHLDDPKVGVHCLTSSLVQSVQFKVFLSSLSWHGFVIYLG